MLRYFFHIYLIFIFCIIIPLKRCTSYESGTIEEEDLNYILIKEEFNAFQKSCYELEKLGVGVCSNVKNVVYQFTFTGVKYLPAGSLSGYSIHILKLDDPDVNVDENIFNGTVALIGFIVKRSSIKIIPDFRFINNSIHGIRIESSHLTSLEGENLQNLSRVKFLYFANNYIRFIDPDVFKGTDNVIRLDLSRNLLTFIPPNLLNPMKNLTLFSAYKNNLLHVNNLFSIMHPKIILLFDNNITDVESVLHPNMDGVLSLHLSGNPIKKLTDNSFDDKIPDVHELYLNGCKLQKFNTMYFFKLTSLQILDLSDNFIEDSDNISDVSNVYNDFIFFQLESLNLEGNRIENLKTIFRFMKVRYVNVAKNRIGYLTNEDFRFLHNTKYLELQINWIRWIESDTFKPMKMHLYSLDLSRNSITSLNGSVRYLSQLRMLNLHFNYIQFLARDEFAGLNELLFLELQHNHIKSLWEYQQLPSLQYLDITFNEIEVIRADQVPESLKALYLRGNTLKCDCRLLPSAFLLTKKYYIERNTTVLFGKHSVFTDINLCMEKFTENNLSKNSNCPENCSCGCINSENNHFVSVDCSSRNLVHVPHFYRNNAMHIEDNVTTTFADRNSVIMKQNMFTWLNNEDRVLGINLENNSLESLQEAQLPPNLIQLFLANNKLRFLPDSILDNQTNLKQVSLSGNPWICDCKALKFKKWLTKKHEVIQDVDNVRCRVDDKSESSLNGKVIWTLNDNDLCLVGIGLTISISLGVLILVTFCLTTKVLYTKYKLTIKIFLYAHGFTFVKEEDLDYDKVFDAFLSFSHEDGEFVTNEIISVIEEKDPTVNLCIHYRHFLAGELIYKNIINAVKNSKRTVVILTKNFLESEWCLIEFRIAHVQAMEDKVHRIIIIKIGDLPKEIHPEIKAYLDSTTYLTWGENNFWNKLLYVLPRGANARNCFRDV